MAGRLDAQERRLRRGLCSRPTGERQQDQANDGAGRTRRQFEAGRPAFSVTATLWAKSSRRAALLPASVRTSLAAAIGVVVATLIDRFPPLPCRSLAET